jgi:ABC-type arginine transport system ATPase subunit
MQTIRIFISSPGDVAIERERAREVVESLRRRYARAFHLKPVLWEDLPLQPDASFQQGIDVILSDQGADIAIFILWSRLGSPTGKRILKDDGGEYRSGTERELDLMLKARTQTRDREGKSRPEILVYTRQDDASFAEALRSARTTEDQKILLYQKELVENFIQETFHDAESKTNVGAFFPFDRPLTFTQRLRVHLQDILDRMVGGMAEVIWDIGKQGPPFLGLESFQFEHADVFFGREEETLEALHALKQKASEGCAFLLLSGASGSGKSSLALAGLLPAIVRASSSAANAEDEPHATVWRSLVVTPSALGPDPIASLVKLMTGENVLPELLQSDATVDELVRDLRLGSRQVFRYTVQSAIEKLSTRQGEQGRLLLAIDQLEELFTMADLAAESRTSFLNFLETAARSGSVWVVATMRSDFYQLLQTEPALVRMKEGAGMFDVLAPQTDALQRLIEEPARVSGLRYEQRDGQSLAHRILNDAAAHAELLPLVGFVLRELYEKSGDERILTFVAYEELGGVEGALAKRAEEVFEQLPAESRAALDSVLQALVTLGGDDEQEKPVRQRAAISFFADKPSAMRLVEQFIKARLFSSARDEVSGAAVVSVAHESLLRVWWRAIEWKNHNFDFLRTRARIASRIKDGSPLLAGDPLLDQSKIFLATHREGFSLEQLDFIDLSYRNAEHLRLRAEKKRRLVLMGLISLTLLSVIVGGVAVRQSQRAQAEGQKAVREGQKAVRQLALADLQKAVVRNVPPSRAEALAYLARSVRNDPRQLSAGRLLMHRLAEGGYFMPLEQQATTATPVDLNDRNWVERDPEGRWQASHSELFSDSGTTEVTIHCKQEDGNIIRKTYVVPSTMPLEGPVFSDDLSRFAIVESKSSEYGSSSTLFVYDLSESSVPFAVQEYDAQLATPISFSPDGTFLMVDSGILQLFELGNRGGLRLIDEFEHEDPNQGLRLGSLVWLSEGNTRQFQIAKKIHKEVGRSLSEISFNASKQAEALVSSEGIQIGGYLYSKPEELKQAGQSQNQPWQLVRHPKREAVLLFFSEGKNTRLELRNEPWQNNSPLWSYFCKAMGSGAEAIFHPEGHLLFIKASDAAIGGGELSVIDPDHGFTLYSVDTVGMHLSGDGKQVVAEGGEGSAGLILPLLQNDSSVPPWLADFAEALGGMKIAEDGGLVRLTTNQRWSILRSSLAAASAAKDPWADFLSKFFSLDIKHYEAPVKGYTGWPISRTNPDIKTPTAQPEEAAAAYIREAKETLAEKKGPMRDEDSAQDEWTEFKHYAEAEAYFNGEDREENLQLAAKHFRIAAEKGYARAQHKLGVCYALGKGVEQNQELAVAWYQKAAAQGFAEAEYDLGVRYILGKGVAKDPVKGRELYRRAAENGNEEAINALKRNTK